MSSQEDVDRIEPVAIPVGPEEDDWIVTPSEDTGTLNLTQVRSSEQHLRDAFALQPVSTLSVATAPPSYRSRRQATLPPYREETPPLTPTRARAPPQPPAPTQLREQPRWTTGMYGALLFIFLAQVLTAALCTDGSRMLARTPGSAARNRGLVAVLASTVVEMAFVWLLAPIAHRIAEGAILAIVYALMAVEVVATSGFLLHCVALDKRAAVCHGLPAALSSDCRYGLSRAIGIGCLRIIVAAPCYLAIFAPYVRRWWPEEVTLARRDGQTAAGS